MNSSNQKQVVEVRPKLGGFLFSYILFSLPGFLTGLIWLLVSLMLFLGIIAGFFSGTMEENNLKTGDLNLKLLREGNEDKTILVYNLTGPISKTPSSTSSAVREEGIYTDLVREDFRQIKKDNKIKNVVFRFNSPGGEAGASKVLGDLIGDLKNHYNQQKAVFYFDEIAASGALWATYKNDNYVVGSPYGQTGSIGVVLTLPNFKGTAEKVGYSETVIKSSTSKDIGNPFRDPSREEVQYFQKQVDKEFTDFKKVVTDGRKLDSKRVDEFAGGFTYFNEEAKNFGLLDQVGDLDLALARASENVSLGDGYRVVEIKSELGLLDSLLSTKAISEVLSLPRATSQIVDRATYLQPGKTYLVDEYRI